MRGLAPRVSRAIAALTSRCDPTERARGGRPQPRSIAAPIAGRMAVQRRRRLRLARDDRRRASSPAEPRKPLARSMLLLGDGGAMKEKVLFGVLRTRDEADDVVAELVCARFAAEDISVLVPHDEPDERAVLRKVQRSALGILPGPCALEVFGLGPIAAAGPIVEVLVDLDSAAASLMALGVSEAEAIELETDLRGGGVLVAVHATHASEIACAKHVFLSVHRRHVEDVARA
jgi:hypothetical protein